MSLEIEKIQDETRKLGTILVAAGAVALVLQGQATLEEAISAILLGIGFIFVGSICVSDNEEEQ